MPNDVMTRIDALINMCKTGKVPANCNLGLELMNIIAQMNKEREELEKQIDGNGIQIAELNQKYDTQMQDMKNMINIQSMFIETNGLEEDFKSFVEELCRPTEIN